MGLNDNYSDYGSGSSSSSWMSQHDIRWPPAPYTANQTVGQTTPRSSSYSDLVMRRCTLEDVMREFQMNGSDSPYNPDEDRLWRKQTARHDLPLSGLGPGSAYVRQKSWPAPERSPAPALPRPETIDFATSTPINHEAPAFAPSTPVFDPTTPAFDPSTPIFAQSTLAFASSTPALAPSTPAFAPSISALAPSAEAPAATDCLTSEQYRVLSSLPSSVLHSLIKQLNIEKRNKNFQECRFCKNNGERESYYRSHALKDGAGRVACPVLRAFTCARCGARGDRAHTIKYCPLSTNEERIKSSAMMRSVRMASGRRRGAGEPAHAHAHAEYVVCGAPTPSVVHDNNVYANYKFNCHDAPLDPLWAALEQKLML